MTDSKFAALEDHIDREISIVSTLRLLIGKMGVDPPTEEEKDLVKQVMELEDAITETLDNHPTRLIIALTTCLQMLEKVACAYDEEMPEIMTGIVCKLTHHASLHVGTKYDRKGSDLSNIDMSDKPIH